MKRFAAPLTAIFRERDREREEGREREKEKEKEREIDIYDNPAERNSNEL